MQVITVGGFKGGTGKSTLSALLCTALELAGKKTCFLDLDRPNAVLTRFHRARSQSNLATSKRVRPGPFFRQEDRPSRAKWLKSTIQEKRAEGFDYLIIDAVSRWCQEVVIAHIVADKVVTTINESPVDLYQLLPGPHADAGDRQPYIELAEQIRSSARAGQTWHLAINRRSPLPTRIGKEVEDHLKALDGKTVIHRLPGLTDRVGYRSMMSEGRTFLDHGSNFRPMRSTVAAVREIQGLVEALTGLSLPFATKIELTLNAPPKPRLAKAPKPEVQTHQETPANDHSAKNDRTSPFTSSKPDATAHLY